MCDLTNPAFTDEDKAREFLEASRWPDGPFCPHCGQFETVKRLGGKSMGAGWYHCQECEKFTVRTGTLYERSHIPLHKWLLATHLLTSSKKGMSAHQLHRMLGITYKSAWFMCHRIREGMRSDDSHKATGGFGGKNEVVEVDETYVGGKAKNRAFKEPNAKKAVVSLIERDGRVASFHVANVTAKTVRPIIVTNVNRSSVLMTDEAPLYVGVGKEFGADHRTVNHSANEYVRLGGYIHVNTAENFYSILKRGITGIYHHVSEAHLHRYLAEFDFRYNNRSALGVTDKERAAKALKGIEGKRLTYQISRQTSHA